MLKYAIAKVDFWLANGIDSCDTWRKSLDGTKALTHIENVETLFPFETTDVNGTVLCRRKNEQNEDVLYEVNMWDIDDPTFQLVINGSEWTEQIETPIEG